MPSRLLCGFTATILTGTFPNASGADWLSSRRVSPISRFLLHHAATITAAFSWLGPARSGNGWGSGLRSRLDIYDAALISTQRSMTPKYQVLARLSEWLCSGRKRPESFFSFDSPRRPRFPLRFLQSRDLRCPDACPCEVGTALRSRGNSGFY